jgi:hypothetical protein
MGHHGPTMGHPSAQRLLHHFIHLSLHLSDLPSAPWIDRSLGRSEHLRSEPNEDHKLWEHPKYEHWITNGTPKPNNGSNKKNNFMGKTVMVFNPPIRWMGVRIRSVGSTVNHWRKLVRHPRFTIGKSSRLSNVGPVDSIKSKNL